MLITSSLHPYLFLWTLVYYVVSMPAAAQVGPLHQVYGGTISHVAVVPSSPNVVYLTTSGAGLFRSSDTGLSWTRLSPDLFESSRPVALLAHPTDPDTLYYSFFRPAGSDFFLWKTTDGGGFWADLTGSLPLNTDQYIPHLVIDPTNHERILAGTGGILETTDGGHTWSFLPNPPILGPSLVEGDPSLDIRNLVIDPQNPNTLYAENFNGLYKTTDSGVTWRSLESALSAANDGIRVFPESIDINALEPSNLYAASDYGLFKTTDGGDSWSNLNDGLGAATGGVVALRRLTIDPGSPNRLLASSGSYFTPERHFVRSTDSGSSWSEVGYLELTRSTIHDIGIAPDSSGSQYVATSAGIFRSTDHGVSWSESSPPAGSPYNILPIPQSETVLLQGAGLYRSDDNGATWNRASHGLSRNDAIDVAIAPSDPQIVFATDGQQFSKSTDGGLSWTPDIADMTPFQPLLEIAIVTSLAIHPNDPQVLIAGNSANPVLPEDRSGLFKSTDSGATWQRMYMPPANLSSFRIRGIVFDPTDNERVYAAAVATTSDKVFFLRSTDGGTSWLAEELLGFGKVQHLAIANGDLLMTIALATSNLRGVLRSVDGGSTWGQTNRGLPDPMTVSSWSRVAVDPATPHVLRIVPRGHGLYVSTNSGQTWQREADFPSDAQISTVAVDASNSPSSLLVGALGGTYRFLSTVLFADGFESGGLEAWSDSSP